MWDSQLILMVGDELLFGAVAVLVQEGQEIAPGSELLAAGLRIVFLQRFDELLQGLATREGLEFGQGLVIHSPEDALQLGEDLFDLILERFWVGIVFRQMIQFVEQLSQRKGGIGCDGLHGGDRFQGFIDSDGIEDVEVILSDAIAPAGGTTQHLLKKDARADAADKDQVADFGHIDACRQQIDCDGDIGQALILELPDRAFRAVNGARDLGNGLIREWGRRRLRTPPSKPGRPCRRGRRWRRKSAFSLRRPDSDI